MIDQAAYAAACDERSYGEPTCEHSDEQNMGGECEACYVKRTAPAFPSFNPAVHVLPLEYRLDLPIRELEDGTAMQTDRDGKVRVLDLRSVKCALGCGRPSVHVVTLRVRAANAAKDAPFTPKDRPVCQACYDWGRANPRQ